MRSLRLFSLSASTSSIGAGTMPTFQKSVRGRLNMSDAGACARRHRPGLRPAAWDQLAIERDNALDRRAAIVLRNVIGYRLALMAWNLANPRQRGGDGFAELGHVADGHDLRRLVGQHLQRALCGARDH